MAFVLFWYQQHGCQNWQQLVFLKGEAVWNFRRHGHINQVSQVWRTEWLTEKVRQWSDSDPAKITNESHLAVVVLPWGGASDKSPFAPDGCLLGWPLPPTPPTPSLWKVGFSSSDFFLLVGINPHPSFSNSKCWVKVWSSLPNLWKGGYICSSLPVRLGGNGAFERKFGRICGNNSEWNQPGRKPYN